MNLTLIRVGVSELGTFGVLRVGQVPFALTLEEPWKDNQKNISSIPAGQYICERGVHRLEHGFPFETYEVMNVPGRTGILFHKGNTLADTEGCILIGEKFGGTPEQPMIESSTSGFAEFLIMLAGQETFELEITEV